MISNRVVFPCVLEYKQGKQPCWMVMENEGMLTDKVNSLVNKADIKPDTFKILLYNDLQVKYKTIVDIEEKL